MLDRARQQYLALLLNVASGKLLTSTIVSADGASVSQALQQVALYILDGSTGNDEVAKDIGDIINNAGMVPAGMIDLDISSIAFRRGLEKGTLLLGARPSPFASSTSIRFRLDAPGEVSINVFDTLGRLVRRLHDGWTAAGQHEVAWNGDSETGRPSVPGVYYVRLVSGGRSLIGTAVLVR
ncbi:MAG: HAF family extracellular repeat-containing protein [bacterium]|nr:MAG: HAF family extracellular repeat-containing protein [bacterium]